MVSFDGGLQADTFFRKRRNSIPYDGVELPAGNMAGAIFGLSDKIRLVTSIIKKIKRTMFTFAAQLNLAIGVIWFKKVHGDMFSCAFKLCLVLWVIFPGMWGGGIRSEPCLVSTPSHPEACARTAQHDTYRRRRSARKTYHLAYV